MSQDQHTRFQLTFNGISLELHGEKEFVEEMYREVMADLEEARARNARGGGSGCFTGKDLLRPSVSLLPSPLLQTSSSTSFSS